MTHEERIQVLSDRFEKIHESIVEIAATAISDTIELELRVNERIEYYKPKKGDS